MKCGVKQAVKRFGDEAGECSFTGSTGVVMADGTVKPISEVEVGDEVLAEDPETGEKGARTVTEVWSHEDTVGELYVDGAKVETTEDHPFWNETDREWQRADQLDEGDLVRSSDGSSREVDGWRGRLWREEAYNLGVDALHTYFVHAGDEAYLVHNSTHCKNLKPGHSDAARRGQQIHNSPEWKEHLDRLGYRRNTKESSPGNIPDAVTPDGAPVELKPDTPSGVKAGTRRLRRYMKAGRHEYGELWVWRETPNGIEFRLAAVPNGSRR